MTISKTGPVDQVQEANPTLTKVQIRQTVETMGRSIKFCLASWEDAKMSGPGEFSVKAEPVGKGRSPLWSFPALCAELLSCIKFKFVYSVAAPDKSYVP